MPDTPVDIQAAAGSLAAYLRDHNVEIAAVGIAGDSLIVYAPKFSLVRQLAYPTGYFWHGYRVRVKMGIVAGGAAMKTRCELAQEVCEALHAERATLNAPAMVLATKRTNAALAAWMAAPAETDELREAREIIEALMSNYHQAPDERRRAKRWLSRNGGAE
jgi:hypothetical protein